MFISLECPAGLYGEHCSNNCGNCLHNTNCHHVNGTCSEGCEPGYQEHNCTEGKYLYRVNLKKIAFERNLLQSVQNTLFQYQ